MLVTIIKKNRSNPTEQNTTNKQKSNSNHHQ